MLQSKLIGCSSFSTIYKSLPQVLETLTQQDVITIPEVRKILSIGVDSKVLYESNGCFHPFVTIDSNANATQIQSRSDSSPFVVMEGLDGCGKTTLTKYIENTLKMRLLCTPPVTMKDPKLRNFFDAQNEILRRAYYSLGNYIAANEVLQSNSPVIMDRFWHSTVAYAIANALKENQSTKRGALNGIDGDLLHLEWPSDLLKPNLVIFLTVSEKERKRRHESRKDFTNTEEEQTLAADAQFRKNLTTYYQSIKGVLFEEVSVDSTLEDSKSSVLYTILKHFPQLKIHSQTTQN